jgi:hypothetical protein
MIPRSTARPASAANNGAYTEKGSAAAWPWTRWTDDRSGSYRAAGEPGSRRILVPGRQQGVPLALAGVPARDQRGGGIDVGFGLWGDLVQGLRASRTPSRSAHGDSSALRSRR